MSHGSSTCECCGGACAWEPEKREDEYEPFPSPAEMVATTLKEWEREFERKKFDELLAALKMGISLYRWEKKYGR